MTPERANEARVLLVEDNPHDVRLAREAIVEADSSMELDVVTDGVAAIDYLYTRGEYADAMTPAFVLLDYNIPKRNGAEVLAAVKSDDILRRIPITIFTTSDSKDDVVRMYDLHANAYVTKPETVEQFVSIIEHLESFWLSTVTLPPVAQHER
ncbi:MAG: response regulator [Halalkalicoccus sp.]|nr:response regulator [Halalkalicoccus sp.]